MSRARDPVCAVTFDAGGTLFEPWPSVGAVCAAVAVENGWTIDATELNRRFVAAWRRRAAFDYSRHAWRSLVRFTFAGLLPAEVADGFFDTLYARFAESCSWRVYPDVGPALLRLRSRGMRLAVLSNWDDRLIPLLARLGLAAYFDVLVVSALVGWHKPSPRIFAEAARRPEVAPATILHVGDSHREDLIGAREAGFQACLLSHTSPVVGMESIRSLDELDSWI